MASESKPGDTISPLAINSHQGYKALPRCARECVNRDQSNRDIEGFLECGDGKVYDTCFCQEELRPQATAWLSLCVGQGCRGGDEGYMSALNVYNDYCSFDLVTAGASSTGGTGTEAMPTSRETADTERESSTAGDSLPGHTSSISAGAIAGIVIGGLAIIMVGLGFMFWMYRRGPKPGDLKEAQQLPGPDSQQGTSDYQGALKSSDTQGYTHLPGTPYSHVPPTRTPLSEVHAIHRVELG